MVRTQPGKRMLSVPCDTQQHETLRTCPTCVLQMPYMCPTHVPHAYDWRPAIPDKSTDASLPFRCATPPPTSRRYPAICLTVFPLWLPAQAPSTPAHHLAAVSLPGRLAVGAPEVAGQWKRAVVLLGPAARKAVLPARNCRLKAATAAADDRNAGAWHCRRTAPGLL